MLPTERDVATERPFYRPRAPAHVRAGARSRQQGCEVPPLPLHPPSEVAESDIVSMVGLEGVPTSREQA